MKVTIWLVRDCKWNTIRGVFLTKKEAQESVDCEYCEKIKIRVEVPCP